MCYVGFKVLISEVKLVNQCQGKWSLMLKKSILYTERFYLQKTDNQYFMIYFCELQLIEK